MKTLKKFYKVDVVKAVFGVIVVETMAAVAAYQDDLKKRGHQDQKNGFRSGVAGSKNKLVSIKKIHLFKRMFIFQP